MKKYKTLIFDFDGTIADSEKLITEIVNELASEHSFRKVEKKDIKNLKEMSVRQVARYLGVGLWRVPKLLLLGRSIMARRVGKLKAFPGIKQALARLKKSGYKLAIASTNTKPVIEKFLHEHQISDFDFIENQSTLFSKAKTIRSLLKKNNIDAKSAVYIGDEIRDVEAAREAGVDVACVAWGFNSAAALQKQKPNLFIKTPAGLVKKFS